LSTKDFEKLSVREVFELLGSGFSGLSEEEARKRLSIYGFNVVEEKKESFLLMFLRGFWGPMPWLLEIAVILSFVIGRVIEAVITLSLLVINSVVRFLHQKSSREVLEMLKSRLSPKAKVFRDGDLRIVDAKFLVPGDVIVVELGDVVPADCKVIEDGVSVDQSVLTGESLPVDVSIGGILFAGSLVKRGRARCVVVNTGMNTYFGRTAELVKVAKPKSHQEEVLLAVMKYSMYIGVAVMIIASVFIYLMGLKNTLISILTFDVSILLGCVPVALPAVMTIMQAVGARELAHKGVLVTRLSAVEDAASVDVFCLDKTGTITIGSLEVAEVIPLDSLSERDVIELALYASAEETQDPIDSAIIKKARELNVVKKGKQLLFKPFDPSTKRAEGVAEIDGKKVRVVKGAPNIVIDMCRDTPADLVKILENLSEKGFRTILVAYGEEDKDLRIAGVIAFSDPPRPNSAELIDKLKNLNIKPVMVTGDNYLIAREIAQRVGIGGKGYPLSQVREKLEEVVEDIDFLAEVYPEDKYVVVKVLQERKHYVGMTGDGVNDAPALKQAELGVAVSNATDVAKNAASAVVLTPGLRGIVDIIDVSRRVYQRALTWVLNKVSKTIQFTLLLAIGLIWLRYDVLSLMGMVLLIFANDFATISLATDNAEPLPRPSRWNIKKLMIPSSIIGLALLIEALIAIYIGLHIFKLDPEKIQTFTLLTMVFTSQFRVLILRERRWFWSSKPGKELTISITSITIAFLTLSILGIIIKPIPLKTALFSLTYSTIFTLSLDPLKIYIFRKHLHTI